MTIWEHTYLGIFPEEERAADDAARRLRGECCQNCDHYAIASGLCWADRNKVAQGEDSWCRFWLGDVVCRARGASLDDVAVMCGFQRRLGEADAELRARMKEVLKDRPPMTSP